MSTLVNGKINYPHLETSVGQNVSVIYIFMMFFEDK